MNRTFHLVEHRPNDPDVADPAAVLYTVHIEGEGLTETDAFFHTPGVQSHPAYDSVRFRYVDLYRRLGLYAPEANSQKLAEKWLRDEGDGRVALCGDKIRGVGRRLERGGTGVLRLYGFCLDRLTLKHVPYLLEDLHPQEPGFPIAIFGGGGVKTEDSPRDCPNVSGHFAAICHVQRLVQARIADGSIEIVDDGLTLAGDLSFLAEP